MPPKLHLSKDRKLAGLIANQPGYLLTKQRHIHLQLCASIISQQLSTKVAAVIYARFLALFNKKNPGAAAILSIDIETMRSIGLSYAKASYVHNVCNFFVAQQINDRKLHQMQDEAIVEYLTQIKGVGRWTVEMLLMFALGREDIFSADDLAIQQAMCKLYKIDAADKKQMKQKMLQISAKWSPYRTYACRYLWGWKDGN